MATHEEIEDVCNDIIRLRHSMREVAKNKVLTMYADLQAENKRLRDVLILLSEILRTKGEIHRPEPLVKPTWICFEESQHRQMEISITQALKEG